MYSIGVVNSGLGFFCPKFYISPKMESRDHFNGFRTIPAAASHACSDRTPSGLENNHAAAWTLIVAILEADHFDAEVVEGFTAGTGDGCLLSGWDLHPFAPLVFHANELDSFFSHVASSDKFVELKRSGTRRPALNAQQVCRQVVAAIHRPTLPL